MQMLVCLSQELRNHPEHVFRWLHRNLVEKHCGALLDRTRIYWNIATQSLQTKHFVISRANRRDNIPLGSQYTSAGSTVFICGWSKGIRCPRIAVFVVERPARYTKHFKYLSRCLLEALPLVSVGNLIPFLMKSRLSLFTISDKCISLRFSCWVAAFPKDLLFFLPQFNFMVMPFHKILIQLCLPFPPALFSVKHPHSPLKVPLQVPAFSSFLLCPVSLGIPHPLHFSGHHYSLQRHYWVLWMYNRGKFIEKEGEIGPLAGSLLFY